MSGIAGILAEGRPDRALLTAMTRRLAERGGIDAAPWIGERAAFAQTSDRGAEQIPFPLRSPDGRLVLVADGVLLNAAELRQRLAGHPDHEPLHDWELAFAAFRLHGVEFIHLLEGDFALALWDQETGTLLLARDHPGARPLCFARTPYGLAFASQARGLLPVLGGPAIEPRALARFLQSGHVAGELTLFAGIEQVPPGSAMIFDGHGAATRVDTKAGSAKRRRIGEADSAQECATLARQALSDTRPCGLLLDGAPSALLLALAAGEAAPQRVWIVKDKSAVLPERSAANIDESRSWPVPLETVAVDAAELIWRLPEAVWACEEPVWDPRLPAWLALAEAAAAHDEWLLCGEGAGETFGGAARYHRPRPHRWVDRLLHPESGGLPGPGIFEGLERQLFGPRLHRAAVDWRQPWEHAWSARKDRTGIARLQATDIAVRVPGRTLAMLDRAGTAHGVRIRAPWLDARMIAFGLSLPDRLKSLRGGGYVQRRLSECSPEQQSSPSPLPPVPLAAWLSGETLNRFEAVLSATPAVRFWFTPGTVHELVTMKHQGKRVASRLGTLLMFALWHRIWIEGDGERPPRCDPLEFLG